MVQQQQQNTSSICVRQKSRTDGKGTSQESSDPVIVFLPEGSLHYWKWGIRGEKERSGGEGRQNSRQ